MVDFRELLDLEDIREPVEVYKAAIGDIEPLAKRFEETETFSRYEREAMSAYVRGLLVPPRRGRGQTSLPYLSADTKDAAERLRIANAVVFIRHIMGELRKEKEHYGRFGEVLNYVAEYDGLSSDEIERVVSEYRRSKPKSVEQKIDDTPYAVKQFHRWLLRTGRLPTFPQPISFFEKLEILVRGRSE